MSNSRLLKRLLLGTRVQRLFRVPSCSGPAAADLPDSRVVELVSFRVLRSWNIVFMSVFYVLKTWDLEQSYFPNLIPNSTS